MTALSVHLLYSRRVFACAPEKSMFLCTYPFCLHSIFGFSDYAAQPSSDRAGKL